MKVFGVVGWKNSGKTGLMERLVAEITARGFSVSTVKHAHHAFDVDREGKDSWRHRQAGAREVLVASGARWALMHEGAAPGLEELLGKLGPVDLVLVEGFKREGHGRIEAHRAATGAGLLAREDAGIVAVASDVPVEVGVPVFGLDDTGAIADFVLREVGLGAAESPTSPALRDDCFALPPGVDWVPVEEALARLRASLSGVVAREEVPVGRASGRVLAADVAAVRSNPAGANAAVDGWGFAHGGLPAPGAGGRITMEIALGRAAAGVPFGGVVPAGKALRILTGALLPEGVDTVVLQEDVTETGGQIAFGGAPKARANTRKAGEDVKAGAALFEAGHRLRAPDVALIAATGVAGVSVHRALRVGVLSTGDEIVEPGAGAAMHETYDANRPMLLAMVEGWGHAAVDLGRVGDDRDALRATLDAAEVEVIITSGGASAGEEDHLSALLREEGELTAWRIALKPGRPLALGRCAGKPLFGLPGNPVAALVCAALFARPALEVLAGGRWLEPQGFDVPAAFEKRKKPGRREYLRARMGPEGVEVFGSEGSGRISGLSWAEGLVELAEPARTVARGDLVRFIPYAALGL
ncbi:MAG: bifunctional molybdopterin-guanine dinucleotide biosynthesis adaptor protein MobB/molybdopterin molybdotransferase MoeA [Vannielia sp.]|uniref:bifunctional molybdopterin-guanine dinucleotide biosynthesis adaptor protein MobB/molybdopterin molybdotransferase MoeA n=1 Tax=Vannielia sp. TaxID=2813045 RepID=UPI003B8AA4B8